MTERDFRPWTSRFDSVSVHLRHGLAAVLVFTGAKMIAAAWVRSARGLALKSQIQKPRPAALPSGRAAVDRVVGACDVRRPVRSDEGRELRDLLGLTEALEKRLSGYRVPGRL